MWSANAGPLLEEMYSKFCFYTLNDRRTLNQAWDTSRSEPVRLSSSTHEATVCCLSQNPSGLVTVAEWHNVTSEAITKVMHCLPGSLLIPFLEPWAAFIAIYLSPGHHAWRKPRNDPCGSHMERPWGYMKWKKAWAISCYYGAPAIPASITMGTTITASC